MDDRQFTQRALGCQRKLYRVALSMLRCDADAADAIQEAVFKGWLHRSALRDGERFEAWLTRILVNECRNIQRRWKRRGEPLDEGPGRGACTNRRPIPRLRDALMALPERLRLPLVLALSRGLSASGRSPPILTIPQTTVKSRLHQARAALRARAFHGGGTMKDLDRAFPPTPEAVSRTPSTRASAAPAAARLCAARLRRALPRAAAVVAVLVGAFSFLHERVRPRRGVCAQAGSAPSPAR